MRRGASAIAAAVAAVLASSSARVLGQLAAFPGALGYGAATTGARADGTGLTVYHVTTLSDGTGAGTFRSAVSQSNRIIVFDVGGNIDITSPVSCASNLTILGQTAPGQGIAIYGAETSFYGQSNDIVRYVRFMDTTLDPGGQGTGNSSGNCINLGNTTNMIFDHVSCEFASYNNIDASGTTGANNLTFQNSIIGDPIPDQQFNFHWQGNQGTFINNIFANSHNRSILAKGNTQFVNNTIYNYQAAFTTGDSSGAFDFDIVNNNFIAGPSTTSAGDAFYQVDSTQVAYASGNILDSNKNGVLDGSADNSTGATVSSTPLLSTTTSLPTLSTSASYAWNVARSGDSLTHDPTTYAPSLAYDETDQKAVINTVTSLGTAGQLYNSQSDDGITDGPTAGIGPVVSGSIVNANYSTLLNPEGYTEVEAWANSMSDSTLVPRIWTASGGEWNTTNNWGTTAPNAVAVPGVYDVAYVEGNGSGTDGLVTVSTTTPVAYQLYIGGNGGAAGEKVQVTSGDLSILDTITVGYMNNAVLEVDGGLVKASNIQLGNTVGSTTYTGSLLLDGGTTQMQQVVLGGGAPGAWTTGGSITFNGGTLQAIGTFNIKAPAVITSSSAFIDSNGNTGTYSGVISGSGALTKLGAGTLSLTATNTFAGGLVLDAGEVGISSDANIDGAAGSVSFLGGLLQIQGTALTSMGTHPFNSSTFNGGFDIVQAANTFTVSQTLGGAGSFTLTGAGALQLTASNSYSGGTTIDGGTLIVTSDNNLGATGGTLSVNGGTLEVSGTAYTNTTAHPLTGNFNGGIDVATTGAVFTVEQQVNGTGNLTKTGPGTLVLGTRDYLSGNAYLDGGTITIDDPLSLRYMTVNFNTSGSTVNLNGIQGPTIGAIIGSQNFDMQGMNPYIGNNNSSTTYSGVLSSSVVGGFNKIGTGTLTLTGSNTFTGTLTISTGILSVSTLTNGGTAGPLGAATNAQGNIVLNGGTLQYTGAGGSTDHLFNIGASGGTLDASGTAAVAYVNTGVLSPTTAANVTLTLTGTNANHNAFEPALADPAGGFTTSLTMSGTGLWDLEGNQKTYSGATTVVTGELQTLATNVMSPNSSVTVDSGATLDFHGYSQTINGLNGAGYVSDSFSHSTDSLTIGQNNAGGSFSGNLGCPNVIKTGTGTQVLSGSDTYTGTTTVNAGVLQFNAADSIGGTGISITVNAGATVAAGYAIDQTDFLNRIVQTSTGCAALAVNSANNLNFSSGSGDANLASVSLGAVGSATYTGTLTPYGTTYLVGGGGGTLTLSNTNAVTGANSLQVVGNGSVVLTAANNLTGTANISSGGRLDVKGSLASVGSVTVDGTTGGATLILDGANAIHSTSAITGITAAATLIANSTQNLGSINSAGSTTFTAGTSSIGTIDGAGSLSVTGGTLTAAHIRQTVFNIGTASTVTIADSAGPGTTTSTSVLTDLSNSGTLDLKNNDLIINDGTQFAAVQTAITKAYNGGAWNQPGITSTSAKANPNVYGLGYATAGAIGTTSFDGQPVASSAVLVKYTLQGDALLTGTIGVGDYNAVIGNLNTGTLWSQGAFHPGSTTGLADYNDVLANFNQTATGSVAVGPALKSAASPSLKTAALSFSPDAATDLKLEVNTVTGDVYALATATTALTGYDIFDKSGNLLDSGDPNTDLNERLLSQPSSTTLGNQTTFRNATNYKLWATILDNTSTLAEGSNNGKLKQGTASTYDTINIPANGTIDFGDIYSTVAHNNDITFAFSEADPTNAGNPVTGSTYNGEVDYVGNAVIPEPGTLGLLGMGGIIMMRRRRTPR